MRKFIIVTKYKFAEHNLDKLNSVTLTLSEKLNIILDIEQSFYIYLKNRVHTIISNYGSVIKHKFYENGFYSTIDMKKDLDVVGLHKYDVLPQLIAEDIHIVLKNIETNLSTKYGKPLNIELDYFNIEIKPENFLTY